MYKQELLQDIKGISGVPLFVVLIIVSFLLGMIELSAQLTVGLVLAYAVTVLIRIFYFKRRPDKESYRTFIEKIDASSFPSLHSLRAGVLATILSLYFGNNLLTILFALCAFAVAFSRVVLKRHFASDAIAGLVLGIGIGLLVARFIS